MSARAWHMLGVSVKYCLWCDPSETLLLSLFSSRPPYEQKTTLIWFLRLTLGRWARGEPLFYHLRGSSTRSGKTTTFHFFSNIINFHQFQTLVIFRWQILLWEVKQHSVKLRFLTGKRILKMFVNLQNFYVTKVT